jgi:hypothetical protein
VVDALGTLHGALPPDGKVVDTQPLSPRPMVFAAGAPVGSVDMRDWARTIAAVDAEVERALRSGLFALESEKRVVVRDSFDTSAEFVEEVSQWGGTKMPKTLQTKIRAATPPITLDQDVRLRLLAKR